MKPNILIVLCFVLFSAKGQNSRLPFRFEEISIQHGLSQSVVSAALQDSKGFMWFGTQDGLNKYDGYTFTVYRNIPFDNNTLSFSEITSLYEDKRGNIWVGTVRGLNRFIPSENAFERYFEGFNTPEPDAIIRAITEDEIGNILVGTLNGLKVLSPSPLSPDRYFHSKTYHVGGSPGGLNGNNIYGFLKDKGSNIWILTGKGLNKLINKSSYLGEIKYLFENRHNSNKEVYAINTTAAACDQQGNFWLSDWNRLYIYDLHNDRKIVPATFLKDLLNIREVRIIRSVNNEIWVYSDKDGLLKIGADSNYAIEYVERFKEHLTHSRFDRMIYSLYHNPSSNENILWIGTEGAGVYKVYLNGSFFAKYNSEDNLPDDFITSVIKDHHSCVWVGTPKGLTRLDRKTGATKNYFTDSLSELSYGVRKIFQDKKRNIWVGTQKGLYLYDSLEDNFKTFYIGTSYKPFTSTHSRSKVCGEIFQDSKGNIWIGTGDGVNKLNTETNLFKFFKHSAVDPNSFLPGFVYAITEDKKGNVWFGTNYGLCKYNSNNESFTRFSHDPTDRKSIPSNVVLSLTTTKSGEMWMSSTQGLSRLHYEKNKLSVENYSVRDGLANDFIYGILEDEKGNLWISSNRGISKFDIKRRNFKNYQEKDGLQSLEFNSFAYFKATDGEMFFGGIKGLNSFYPKQEPVNTYIPPVQLSKILLFGKSLSLDSLFRSDKSIELNHDQNSLLFEFSALSYKHPEANQYAYKLEGLDDRWIELGNRRIIAFNKLNPGTYILKVKASNDNGVWNEKGISLTLKINPPFYLTTWFYLIIASILVAVVILINSYLVRRRVRRLMVLQEIRNEEQEKIRKKTAEDFHDELGNKLTRISILAELAKVKGVGQSDEVSKIISMISDNANTLFYGTKDLIWSINPKNDSYHELAIRLKDFGDELYDNTEIKFEITGISEALRSITLPMDTGRHIVLIFKEAMTNVLKHSFGKNVVLSLEWNDERLSIQLQDDGKGFFTAKEKSDGNGLCNMKSRAKKINSELIVQSVPGNGTVVRLICPIAENKRLLQKHLSN